MHRDTTQTSDGGGLRFICFGAAQLQPRPLTLLTQHILQGVDFGAVKATPGGRTDKRGQD